MLNKILKQFKERRGESFRKGIIYTSILCVATTSVYGYSLLVKDSLSRNLTPEKMDNSSWYSQQVSTPSHLGYCFEREGFFQDSSFFDVYVDGVRKRNNRQASGNLELPDINGDGSVCNAGQD